MPTLLIRLTGPLQSWGTTSRFDERDTQLEPSKSGVIGLLCAALGRDRSEPVNDLANLRMGVRVDREGIMLRDYHTAQGVVNAAGKVKRDAVVSTRYFLADAVFLVGLEGQDRNFLRSLHEALRNPVWPLYLGRKAFVPGLPLWMPDALVESRLEEALRAWPPLTSSPPKSKVRRVLLEDPSEGVMRMDQPIGPFSTRRFGPRYIRTEYWECT